MLIIDNATVSDILTMKDCIRVQEEAHMRSALQFLAIVASKAHRRAELRHGVAHPAAGQRNAAHIGTGDRLLPETGIEIQRP